MDQQLGHVMTVSGSQVTVSLDFDDIREDWIRLGALLKIQNGEEGKNVVGAISAIQVHKNGSMQRVLVADLLGEINRHADMDLFSRGISRHPIPGATVRAASEHDIDAIYAVPTKAHVRIGSLHHDESRPAHVLVNELLTKHFAVIGATGSGKSCSVTLILQSILSKHPNAHILLLDPHNEYSTAFGDLADLVSVEDLRLPLWLFDFEESARVLVRGGTALEQEAQTIILREAITFARREFAGEAAHTSTITCDTPVPYRVFDLLRFLNDQMGRLDKPDAATPYLRLRMRLESLREDSRYAFMFDRVSDTLSDIVGRLLRIPVHGKPLTIVDLSGVPSEITDVIVSLSCRMLFDFAVWADRDKMPPILLVCEEAHRYVPADQQEVSFDATARAIRRIAKEGRKYGISLALVSQRPTELSQQALTQCGTVFALRLGSEADQQFISRVLPDAAKGMLSALPSLRTQEAIISGEGIALPTRIRFDDLPPGRRPRSSSADFSRAWQIDSADEAFRDEVIRRWRDQAR